MRLSGADVATRPLGDDGASIVSKGPAAAAAGVASGDGAWPILLDVTHNPNPTPNPNAWPIPLGVTLAVLLVNCAEAVNIVFLFPFMAFMLEDMGFTGHRLGYYCGGLAASFCSGQVQRVSVGRPC